MTTSEERERAGRGRAAQVMRSLRGPDRSVEARVAAVMASSPAERIRFLLDCTRMLRDFLVETEWRAPAILEIARQTYREDVDGNDLAVDQLWDTFECFRNYVLFGDGQHSTYVEPQTSVFRLSDAGPELERRVSRADQSNPAAATVRRISELAAIVAELAPGEAEKIAAELEQRAATVTTAPARQAWPRAPRTGA